MSTPTHLCRTGTNKQCLNVVEVWHRSIIEASAFFKFRQVFEELEHNGPQNQLPRQIFLHTHLSWSLCDQKSWKNQCALLIMSETFLAKTFPKELLARSDCFLKHTHTHTHTHTQEVWSHIWVTKSLRRTDNLAIHGVSVWLYWPLTWPWHPFRRRCA